MYVVAKAMHGQQTIPVYIDSPTTATAIRLVINMFTAIYSVIYNFYDKLLSMRISTLPPYFKRLTK